MVMGGCRVSTRPSSYCSPVSRPSHTIEIFDGADRIAKPYQAPGGPLGPAAAGNTGGAAGGRATTGPAAWDPNRADRDTAT